ncbi:MULTISPECIES: hypothetical protein [Rhizobium/Agrobacterium group]|uniref:hypothetical protein n=1 Tax=Rhizobium/Agrobacterium group TaxID=227290 RepID=UPI0012E70D07|nr:MULTISPECIES: hypothetical protein [Rhizobium/Agrobacterium group]MCF1474460.1 hypothetical protein [Allorhizobium ampelinum]MVA50921.1 hypothetical protein [Agrobacterium vitis]NSZ52461.1 hypothetical protein [Agrobacterium vitis]NTA31223.1 hypothetical protein [Agrobacterium vitis]
MTGTKLLSSFCVAISARKSTLAMRIYLLLDSSVEVIRKPRVKLKVVSSPDINFRNIRKHRSSQNDGFEELTRQLVLAEPPEGATEIEHRGPGADGGVEIIVRFADGRVWGWQSKYFTDGFGSSEVSQIKTSFSAALTNFPKLERYYVAIPRNLSGHAEGENDTQTKNWKNFKQWCEDEANALKRKVEIVLWDDTYFVSRLQRSDPAHAGMRLYWFDETVLDQDWFERQLSKSLAFIGKRYREADHVDVKIGDTLEIMTKGRGFLQRIDSVWSIIAASTEKLAAAIKTLDKTDSHIADFEQAVSLLGELSKAAEETDPTKLADQRIASLLKMLRDVENNGSVDFVLRQARFMTREDPKKPDREREPYVYPPKIRNLLAELQSDIMDASLEFSLEEIELFRTPALLVEGEAGIGKSHIIARDVQRHVQQGHPAVFIPGRTLDQGDKPESEILHYLDLKDLRFETFLGALDAAAKASGRPALIAIDGINESLDAAGWEPGLPKLISQVRQFDQIGFCASIRSAYKKLCIRTGLDVVTVQHVGFSANFGEVARQYLDCHGIERPSAPIFELRDILYNPLFLTTAVDFLLATKQTSFPRGLDSISKLIDFWLEAIEINLTTRRYDRIERGDGKILEVAEAIAAKMAEDGSEYLDFKTANVICEQIVDLGLPTKATDRLLMKLIDEGMFLDTPDYSGSKTGKHISFAFQKFSDYFIADAVLRHTGDAPALAAAIKPGGKYHYLFDEETPWKFAGPRTALFALTAICLGKELPDLEADIGDHVFFSAEDFLDSLRWRQGNAILEETRELLEDIRARPATADESELFYDVYFDVLLRLAGIPGIPGCRLNALYLKERLGAMTLADRDATWSLYLVRKMETYDEEWSIVQELIDWSWTAPAAEIGSEKIHLIATTIALMTSTMDREVRDRATKALSSLLMKFPAEIVRLIEEFKDWDDSYVRERVLAAAMGGALYCVDLPILKSAAEAADRMVFAKQPVERHAWVRRYAHLIVLHANSRGAALGAALVGRATPPYASPPISDWPTLADLAPLHEIARDIFSSVIGYLSEKDGSKQPMMAGDFGRYTISGIDNSFSAEKRGENPPVSRDMEIEQFWADVEEADPRAAGLQSQLERGRAQKAEGSMAGLLKRVDIEALLAQMDHDDNDSDKMEKFAVQIASLTLTEDTESRAQLEKAYDDLEASLLALLTPELRDRYQALEPLAFRSGGQIEKFSIQTARNWIVDRALKLGWDPKVHQPIERQALRYSHGRHDHQIERIGKKYQHIAHQELIGYLADHHWYLDWNSPASILRELERFNRSDIDPTYLASEFVKQASTFFPEGVKVPEMRFTPSEPLNNMEWTKTPVDLPDVVPFLIQKDVDGQEWYLQKSFARSLGYMNNLESTDPFKSAQLSIELVLFKVEDVGRLDELTTESLDGDDGDVFDRGRDSYAFYGQRSARHLSDPVKFELTQEITDIKFGRFVESYSPKFGEYDRSGVPSDKGFNLPTAALFSSQKLRPKDAWSACYVSEDGKPAFVHDHDRGDDGVTLVRADVMKGFAKQSGLKPVWIVWGEKDGGKGNNRLVEEERLFARNDFLGFYYELDGVWHGNLIRFRNY